MTGCLVSSPSQVGQASDSPPRSWLLGFLGVLQEQSPRCAVCLPWRADQAVTLLVEVSHPGSQEDTVSSWEPVHSLVEDVDSGAKIEAALCLLALAVGCLPSASGDGGPYMAAGLLSFGICSILCSVSVPGVAMQC